MKAIGKRIISIMILTLMIASGLPAADLPAAAYAADAGNGYKDSLLSTDPGYYNNKLALVSAELCLATYTADSGKHSTDIDRMLLDMGCDYVSSEDY